MIKNRKAVNHVSPMRDEPPIGNRRPALAWYDIFPPFTYLSLCTLCYLLSFPAFLISALLTASVAAQNIESVGFSYQCAFLNVELS